MLLLAPFVLHLWKNWKPLAAHAKRKTLFVPLALSLVVAVPFAVMACKGRAGKAASQTIALLTQASLVNLAPVFRSTPETLLQRLQLHGYKASSTGQSPSAIGSASAVPANEVLYSLMRAPTQEKISGQFPMAGPTVPPSCNAWTNLRSPLRELRQRVGNVNPRYLRYATDVQVRLACRHVVENAQADDPDGCHV